MLGTVTVGSFLLSWNTRSLVDDRLHHGILEVSPQAAARRLDHQHRGHLFLPIHPEVGAEGPAPSETAGRAI